MKTKTLLITLVLATTIGCTALMVGKVEEPPFTATQVAENIEMRTYKPLIVAETITTGDRKEAISQGFRVIADYIFGNNTTKQEIAMTAPVMQQASVEKVDSSEKIAMTAPVLQQQTAPNTWAVRFVMPSEYTLQTLPKPNNSAVVLKEIPAQNFAVIRFSGRMTAENLSENQKLLETYIAKNGLQKQGEPQFAFYNPPWTLPFFRRNEVMFAVE